MISEGELGPEFSESEIEKLGFIKEQVDKGEIGGPEDKPSENREFVKHTEPPDVEKADPAWRNLPPELQEEVKMVLGPQIHVSRERSPSLEEQGKERCASVDLDSIWDKAFVLLERYYPEFGISTKQEPSVIKGGYQIDEVGIWADPDKEEVVSRVLNNPMMEILTSLHHFARVKAENDQALFIRHLDRQGILSQEDSKRLIAYFAKSLADKIESKFPKLSFWENRALACRDKIKQLNIEPYSDEEVSKFLLEKVIIPEFGPPANA